MIGEQILAPAEDSSILETLRSLQRRGSIPKALELLSLNPSVEFSEHAPLLTIVAAIHALSGNPGKAAELAQNIDPKGLLTADDLADYGLLLFLLGRPDEAEEYLLQARTMNPMLSVTHARLAALYLTLGRHDEAEPCLMRALELEPERAELLANLGTLRFRQGRLEEALELFNRALMVNPDLTSVHRQKAQVMMAMDRSEELIDQMYEKIRSSPDDTSNYIILTAILLSTGRESEAISLIEGALDRFPDDESVRQSFIQACFQAKRFWDLGIKLKEWVDEKPESIHLRFLLNRARIECGFLDAAEQDLEAFEDDLKEEPAWKILKAKIYMERNEADRAVEILQDLVERFPGHVEARTELAHILLSIGRKEEAREHIETLAQIAPVGNIQLLHYGNYEASEDQIRALEAMLNDPTAPVEERMSAGFTLAEVFQKRKEFEKSFETVIKANELARGIVRYDWKEHRRLVQRIMEAFTKETIERLSGTGHESTRPIFITGMPRSGTTLVEQILSSHSMVYGAGELPWIPRITSLFPRVNGGYPYPEGIHRMDGRHMKSAAEYYLEKLELYNKDKPRVTDKLPHNFDNIGLIALMFPNAKILHLKRDPRDVAVSNYYQNFAALRGLMGFAFDLRDIGHMLNDHDRIMAHWHEVLPGRIFEVPYEELVANPEKVIREMLEFCELPWEDNVLRFYETRRPVKTASIQQVRQGIYTDSAARWRRYEKFLGPLLEVLEEGFIPLED